MHRLGDPAAPSPPGIDRMPHNPPAITGLGKARTISVASTMKGAPRTMGQTTHSLQYSHAGPVHTTVGLAAFVTTMHASVKNSRFRGSKAWRSEHVASVAVPWEMRDRLGTAVPDAASDGTLSDQAGSAPTAVASAREDRPTIEQAVRAFVTSMQKRQLSSETVRKSEALLARRLVPWCEQLGHRALADLRVTSLDAFRATWKDGPSYAKKNLERLRAFFQSCEEHGWLTCNPAKAIKLPQVRRLPVSPFSVEEMERILAACDRYRGNRDVVVGHRARGSLTRADSRNQLAAAPSTTWMARLRVARRMFDEEHP